MAAPVIQFKRGLLTNLPGLRAGEPGFTTDAYDLYVGIDSTTNNNQFVGSGRYWQVNTATAGSGVKLVEGTNNGTNAVTLKSPDSLAASYTLTMPADDGDNGDVLTLPVMVLVTCRSLHLLHHLLLSLLILVLTIPSALVAL